MKEFVSTISLKEQIDQIFHDIIPESVARRCKRDLRSIKNNNDLYQRRLAVKDSVSELLERICELQDQSPHKIQTLIRKSPPEDQLFLIERVLTIEKWLSTNDEQVAFPSDFASFVRMYLIDAYNDKLQDKS